jgi:predicted cupin superfamily sugar epimerase
MRRVLVAVVSLVAMTMLHAATPAATDTRAREIIRTLKLVALPKESGYLGIVGVSTQKVNVGGRMLAVQSQNYYMLTRERPINYLHWLASDDTHILVEGGPVDYFIFHPDGRVEEVTLGFDYAAGQRPMVAVPGGCWKALRLHEGASYALMVNTLSPEFTPDRVKIGAGADWVKRLAGTADWATSERLKEFIGPNWIP